MKIKFKKIILLIGLILLAILLIYSSGIFQCYNIEYIVVEEYLGNYTSKNESILKSCYNCLWIDAVPINPKFTILYYNSFFLETNKRKFFFANEYILLGLEPNDRINMRWCKTPLGDRIRGVTKHVRG